MHRFSSRPSPAMVVAFIALLAALSGTAVALPGKNTVDSGDIRKGAVKRGDIARNAVNSAKVRNGSLLAEDFAAGQLPAGPKGDKGDTGAKGDKGDPGDAGTAVAYATVTGAGTVLPSKSKNITQANLDPDTVAGNYCFTDLPFTPRSVMVAGQAAFDGGQADVIATAFMADISVSTGDCLGKVLVRTHDVSDGSQQDRAFQIWFED
jgi:hypothetical protein